MGIPIDSQINSTNSKGKVLRLRVKNTDINNEPLVLIEIDGKEAYLTRYQAEQLAKTIKQAAKSCYAIIMPKSIM